jgi:poly(3-hydroxybutyrate) depolymerase
VICGAMISLAVARPVQAQLTRELVRAYLWPTHASEYRRAADRIAADSTLVGVSRAEMLDLEELLRAGRFDGSAATEAVPVARLDDFTVAAPGGRQIPVTVRLPGGYTPARQWPLIFAMHGGPPGSVEGATRSAGRLIDVWAESAEAAGWLVASPAMVDVVSRDGRTRERLPYEIFHPEEARALVDAVRARYAIDPDRIVSTGISLGSNFSIAYGAARPDWLSAIVPVSTEGDSREALLRNLATVPTYVLEGSQDQNIRGVGGPRMLSRILTDLGYDIVYREFSDRAHEGFMEHYPDVLRWLDSRPRRTAPRDLLRVPHSAIVPVARRIHWVEADTRQALVRARVLNSVEIDITARWAGAVTLYLNDHLVDLDRPITVRVNGAVVHEGILERSAALALAEARRLGDERRVYSVRLTVEVPLAPASLARARALSDEVRSTHQEGTLSFWEMYAVRALEERFPSVGFDGDEVALPTGAATAPEQVGIEVTQVEAGGPADRAGIRTGDVVVRWGGEPFFEGRGGVAGLHAWLVRELRTQPRDYEIVVWREGVLRTLAVALRLGPYADGAG